MAAYAELQAQEFAQEGKGYRATTHQKFVGTGYFDLMSQVRRRGRCCVPAARAWRRSLPCLGGRWCARPRAATLRELLLLLLLLQIVAEGGSSTTALKGSTEEEQFAH